MTNDIFPFMQVLSMAQWLTYVPEEKEAQSNFISNTTDHDEDNRRTSGVSSDEGPASKVSKSSQVSVLSSQRPFRTPISEVST
jgi:hypothetical protein